MRKTIAVLLILMMWGAGNAKNFSFAPANNSWWSLDIFHQSRALPPGDRFVRAPMNPGYQLSHHHSLLGSRSLRGAGTLQAGYTRFDQLFWAVTIGTGIEGVWNSQSGFYAAFALRLDYERIFTGNNNFELENGRYKQKTDTGRSYLQITPLDLSIGYAPPILRSAGLIPALRFAWQLDVPLYGGDDPNPWSYTQLGLSINWMIGG
ncbi:MAG: hypothetical protein GF313_11830 [Caldithrix sp.]|nr:hypothetical protein [Caldithrix sp.]